MLVLATNIVFDTTFSISLLFALISPGVSHKICETLLILHANKIKEKKGKQRKIKEKKGNYCN